MFPWRVIRNRQCRTDLVWKLPNFSMANLELCNKKEFVKKEIKKLHNRSVCIRAWGESLVPRFYSPLIEIKLKMQNRWLKITAFANRHPRILACFCVVSPFFYDYWHFSITCSFGQNHIHALFFEKISCFVHILDSVHCFLEFHWK